jgi:hypothetical protein
MMVFFIFMFSSGIPVLYPIGCLSCITTYYVDKIFFVKLSRTPPQYTCVLADWATSTMRFAVVLHCFIAAWMYSSPETFPTSDTDSTTGALNNFFQNDEVNLTQFTGSITSSSSPFLAAMAIRLSEKAALLPLILGFIILAWKIFRRFNFVIKFFKSVFHCCLRTSRTCMHATFDELMISDEVSLTFSMALKEKKLAGLASYNILANPSYQNIFQLNHLEDIVNEGAAENGHASSSKSGQKIAFHSLADALQLGHSKKAIDIISVAASKSGSSSGHSDANSMKEKKASSKSGEATGTLAITHDTLSPLPHQDLITSHDKDGGDDGKSVISHASSKTGRPAAGSAHSEGSKVSNATQTRKGREWESRAARRHKHGDKEHDHNDKDHE